jgi:hypothetical protein
MFRENNCPNKGLRIEIATEQPVFRQCCADD